MPLTCSVSRASLGISGPGLRVAVPLAHTCRSPAALKACHRRQANVFCKTHCADEDLGHRAALGDLLKVAQGARTQRKHLDS